MTINAMDDAAETDPPLAKEARVWRDNGWTARVIKNEDDEGWAVEMILDGEVEPVLVGPWTMGRDKRNPKPFDSVAFNTLVKTASEFRLRQEQQLHAAHHQSIFANRVTGEATAAEPFWKSIFVRNMIEGSGACRFKTADYCHSSHLAASPPSTGVGLDQCGCVSDIFSTGPM